MPYLIDSDVLSDYLAGEPQAKIDVESLVLAGVGMSIVTWMETWQGTLRTADPIAAQMHHAGLLTGIPVLPLSFEIARTCAQLRSQLQQEGKRVRSRALDLIIAATALEHDLTLVTRNKRDYQDIPGLELA